MNAKDINITIIGGGNIGASLARGLAKSGNVSPDRVTITRRRIDKLTELQELGIRVSSDNSSALAAADVVVIAVLPQQLNELLNEIGAKLTKDQIVISVVSGVTIDDVKSKTPNGPTIVRAMPNTAIAIGESMTCIAGTEVDSDAVVLTKELFDNVGETIRIREEQMTSATALCACGIAFFLRAVRAASQGGVEVDFHADEALRMAAQTAKGAAALLLSNETHPEDEIDKVTSPKGCTIAGLNQMEHNGFSSSFIKGITTSAQKAGGLYEAD